MHMSKSKRRIAATAAGAALVGGVALVGAPGASAATTYKVSPAAPNYAKCVFSDGAWTPGDVVHETAVINGVTQHRVYSAYMGTKSLVNPSNDEYIVEWKVQEMNSTGTVNYGGGQDFLLNQPNGLLGAYDESDTSNTYVYPWHAGATYVEFWMKRKDGKACWTRWQM